MIRFCPNCETERPADESFCEGRVGDLPCGWGLTGLPLRPEGWRPAIPAPPEPAGAPVARHCGNGHPAAPGDLLCDICGEDIVDGDDGEPAGDAEGGHGDEAGEPTVVDGWPILDRRPAAAEIEQRFTTVRESDGQEALLILYDEGSEPDADVYDALRQIDRAHVPEIMATGRWNAHAYEVREDLAGDTLAELGLLPDDEETLRAIVEELGAALYALAECGLRHRDLHPGAILVRDRAPLDLVITGFGSARLSDYDLDIVSPLEITRYTAPEAVAGGVAAASDWWSLGMILLEQVTRGDCFAGADDQTFLIHVLTNGAPIPADLAPGVERLLRGLLAADRRQRWGWDEVRRWLAGEMPSAPEIETGSEAQGGRRMIGLGSARYGSAQRFALAAAQPADWDEALRLLHGGELLTWLEDAGHDIAIRRQVRAYAELDGASEDIRLALALKTLNPAMPLVVRGQIVTPGWLLDHPGEGYALITGPVPEILEAADSELWLARLRRRETQVRERARQLEVELDEALLRANVLSTSKSRLAAIWDERRRILADTEHPGLLAIVERRITAEEDYILLLSAAVHQFRTVDVILDETEKTAFRAAVVPFDRAGAGEWLARSRRDMNAAIEARLEGFARCDLERVDEWADRFRIERRLPIVQALALLSVPEDAWQKLARQQYVATLLEFYARRITGAIMRGPLTRMVIGKTTSRLDLMEVDSARRPAAAILDHILLRGEQRISFDPAPFMADPKIERRLRTLHSHATLYRRDTGIDGLYLGFPFLVMQEAKPGVRPRIAPILLWPVQLNPAVGARADVTLAFDRGREEVRLNPAFDTLLGVDTAQRWKDAADALLGRASVTAAEVMETFAAFAVVASETIQPVPSKDIKAAPGEDRLFCSAALFHLGFFGQAVMEDLRQLKSVPPSGTGLETALRVGEEVVRPEGVRPREVERYFTSDSDPSQEAAVLEARLGRGLVIEGPPGTGKSQTIVNMVADAIGTGRSLLVVCQKQTALEVVHKRLEAAGLGKRIVMINDVNRDRENVIRMIREQIEDLYDRPSWMSFSTNRRAQVAARIENIEGELDRHHRAMHRVDPATGLSFRSILGELIALAASGEIFSLPVLRQQLGPLDPGAVATIEEICGPLARVWLPARYEGSALAITRPFAHDDATVGAFRSDLDDLADCERDRLAVIERTPNALLILDPEPYRGWSRDHGAALLGLGDSERVRLARWLAPLGGASTRDAGTTPWQRELAALETAFLGLPTDDVPADALHPVLALDDNDLADWLDVSDRLAARPGFWERLSPARWLAGRRQRRFLKAEDISQPAEFRRALQRERDVRPLRERLVQTRIEAGEPAGGLASERVDALLADARALAAALADAEICVGRLEAYPEPPVALAMAKAATRGAVDDLIEGIDHGLARHAARTASLASLARLEPWIDAEWIAGCRDGIGTDRSNAARIDPLLEEAPHISAYQRFRARVPQLAPDIVSCFTALSRIRGDLEALPAADLEPMIRRIIAAEARLAWKARLEAAAPELLLEADELETKVKGLADADLDIRQLNKELLIHGADARDLAPRRDWENITRLRGQRARRLREFVELGADLGLMKLRPIWLVNPDVASRLLPLRKGLFDTVIYDEASQIPIEYALPTLYRGARMVVSGDEKQMPPTAFFASRVENDEAEIFEGHTPDEDLDEAERAEIDESWNRREIKDCPDLLQLAKSSLPATTLQIHYRSVYRELVEFSNAAFYANRLSVPARHPADEILRKRPIELVRVDGVYEDQTNPAEARRVAEIVRDLWCEGGSRPPTLGVVTFNRKQADLIDEVLEELAESDLQFREALTRERDRIEGGEDVGFFVKNVENVQGDERDIMVFSSTFGRNAQGAFRRAFGVLGQTGGERRLNVAVTRARQKIILVTSMPIALISDFLSTRRPPVSPRDYLQAYFEYARLLSDGDQPGAEALLRRLAPGPADSDTSARFGVDGLDTLIAEEIRALGWEPVRVGDVGAFGLDFAIEDPRTGLYGIAIECDAPRHRLLETARAREIWRAQVLRRSIPVIHRVSSHRWFDEPEIEKGRLRQAIVRALGEAA
ncbi:AAA domain-containing protein [Sphingopyxis fribergensis]